MTNVVRGDGSALGVIADPTCAATAAGWAADAVPEHVAPLRAAVASFASRVGAPVALVDDIRLAVSEALNNTVLHAYRNAGGRIDVRASVDPAAGVITIAVRDYGIGCAPRTDSPGIGMGLPLMSALARTVDVAAPLDGGTDVRLTFAVPAA